MKGLSDTAGRLAWMEQAGHRQAGQRRLAGLVRLRAARRPRARPGAGCSTTRLLAAAKAEPRFVPLASRAAAGRRARRAPCSRPRWRRAFRGAMISTLPRGIGSVLDAKDLDPFWTAADDTGAVIHIHPAYDAGESRVNDYGLANGVGRVTDAVVAMSRLAMHRPHHALPQRQVLRADRRRGAAVRARAAQAQPRDHARTSPIRPRRWRLIYTDTIVHDPRVLRFVVEMIGADRVMMAPTCRFRSARTSR